MPACIRQIRVEGNIAYVPLTKGYEAIIDADDVPLMEGFNWCAEVQVRKTYAHRKSRQLGRRRTVYIHREVMGDPGGFQIDHINGNGLDCRKSNLRVASNAENAWNTGLSKKNTSGFKGVYWSKQFSMWHARISVHGTRYNLGFFTTPEEAHRAYCAASSTMRGDFGRVS